MASWLQDVLSRASDKQKLAAALQPISEGGKKLEMDAEGLQGLVRELLQAGGSAGLEGIKLAALLLSVAVDKVDLDESQQRSLLQSKYAAALGKLVDRASEVVVAHQQAPPEGLDSALAMLFNAVGDLATYSAGRPAGGGRAPRGRDLHGTPLIPCLISFLVAPAEAGPWACTRQRASSTLLEFLVNCRPNCELLAAIPDSVRPLFGDLLRGCGDVACQIDLLEAVYRCGRAGVLRDEHRALFTPDFLAALDALAAHNTKGGALDLAAELRKLLVAYNRQLGSQATVYCAQAKSLLVSGIDGLAAPGMWVDFGLRALAVGLHMPEPGDSDEEGGGQGGASRQPELEVVQFPYTDMLRMHTASGPTAGYERVTVSLRAMPEVLQNMSQSFKGQGNLEMQFKRGLLPNLPSYAPRVADAMRIARVAFAADGTLSGGGGGDMSQRGRKCSTGFTVYDKPDVAVPGRSSGRAPLHLTRSGHTPGIAANRSEQRSEQCQQPAQRARSNLGRGTSPAPLELLRQPPPAQLVEAPEADPTPAELQHQQQQAMGQEQPEEEQQPMEQEQQPEEDRLKEQLAEEEPERVPAPAPNCSGAQVPAGERASRQHQQSDAPSQAARPEAIPAPATSRGTGTGTATAAAAAPAVAGGQHRGCATSQCPAPSPSAARPASTAAPTAAPDDPGEVNSPPPRPLTGPAAKQQVMQRLAAAAPGPAPGGSRGLAGAAAKAGASGVGGPTAPDSFQVAIDSEGEQDQEQQEQEELEEEHPAAAAAAGPAGKKKEQQQQELRMRASATKGRQQAAAAKKQATPTAAATEQQPRRGSMGGKGGGKGSRADSKGGGKGSKAGGKGGGKGSKAGGKGGGKGSSLDVEDDIEERGLSGEGKKASAVSPTPSWMRQDEDQGAGAASASSSSDSESELRHDHASKQPLHKAAAAANAREHAAAAAAAVRGGAEVATEQGEDWEEGWEKEEEEEPIAKKQQPAKRQPAGKKAAAAGGRSGKPAGNDATAKAAAASTPATDGRPCRPEAAIAEAKLAKPDCGQSSEEQQQQQGHGRKQGAEEVFEFQAPAGEHRQPKKDSQLVAAGGGRRQVKSPFKTRRVLGGGKLAGKKRRRDTEPGPEASEEPRATVAVDGGMLDAEGGEREVQEVEEVLPRAQKCPQVSPRLSSSSDEEGGDQEHQTQHGAEQKEEVNEEEQQEEEEEEEEEEKAAPTGGYQSEGTGHLRSWTNFQGTEADVPDMLVAEDDLRVITKRFKFTAVKEPAPAAAAPAAAAATAGGGGASTGRRKAELKAAAAGVAKKKAPELLLGLSGAKAPAKGARLTTTLSQEGLVPLGATIEARGTTAKARQQQQQQRHKEQREQRAAAGGKRTLEALGLISAQKRQKTGAGTSATQAAAAKPAAAATGPGGRSSHKALAAGTGAGGAAAAAGASEGSTPGDSQAPSIHHLLHSVQRRHAAASQHPSEDESDDEEGDDMAALQAFMVEVVRKRKAATQRKQASMGAHATPYHDECLVQAFMVAELESEVAATLGAQQQEMQQAQQHLDAAVGQKFAALEKQLEGKMREIDAATLAFQQRLNALWEQYRALYDQLAAAATEAEAAAGKQRAAAAASLESMRATLAARAAEVGRKIERGSKKASKMPELAQMLMPFLD